MIRLMKPIMYAVLLLQMSCSPTVFGLIAAGQGGSSGQTKQISSSINTQQCIDIIVEDDQTIADVKPTIEDNEISTLGVTYIESHDRTLSTLEQSLEFPKDTPTPNQTLTGSIIRFNPRDLLYFKEDVTMLNYYINSSPPLNSNIDMNGNLDALKDQRLNLLGHQYLVAKAKISRLELDLELLYGRPVLTSRGEVTKRTVNGVEYTVAPIEVDARERTAEFVVNGFSTGVMEGGDVVTLPDGMKFAHGGYVSGFVRYMLNPHMINIYDNDISDNLFTSGGISVNDERSHNSDTKITGSISNAILYLDSITIRMKPINQLLIGVQESMQSHYDPISQLERSVDIHYIGRHNTSNTLRICVGD